MKAYRYFDLLMAAFVTILVVSNIASSAKIVDWGFSLFGVPMAFDAGTLLFPVSYIFGDVLTEVYGYRRSRRVIWVGFFLLALSALLFWIVGELPPDRTWTEYAGQPAYDAILGGMSSGGIVLGSLAGYWAGEFSNSITLARLKLLTKGRLLWLRTISSTLIGQLIDTAAFVVIASLFGVFPWSLLLTLVLTNYIFKCAVEVLMTPATYAIVNRLKKIEQEDFYDAGTDFNPFKS